MDVDENADVEALREQLHNALDEASEAELRGVAASLTERRQREGAIEPHRPEVPSSLRKPAPEQLAFEVASRARDGEHVPADQMYERVRAALRARGVSVE